MPEKPQIDWALVVENIRGGDPAGEEILYRELKCGARLFLQRRLGTRDVEDHVHDVFLIVLEAIRSGALREPERLMGFVRTILYRQLNRAISGILNARQTSEAIDTASLLSNREPDPEQRVLDEERIETMKQGLRKMKRKDVEILTRYYLREQQPDRICQEMSLTRPQFLLRKSRAKARLADLLRNH